MKGKIGRKEEKAISLFFLLPDWKMSIRFSSLVLKISLSLSGRSSVCPMSLREIRRRLSIFERSRSTSLSTRTLDFLASTKEKSQRDVTGRQFACGQHTLLTVTQKHYAVYDTVSRFYEHA